MIKHEILLQLKQQYVTVWQRCFKYTWYEYKYEYKYTGSKYEYEYKYTRCEYEYEYEYTGHEYKYEYEYQVIVSDVVVKTSTRRRSRIPCVVVEKITTRRREGIGVVVEKRRKSTNFQQKFVYFTYSNNAHINSVCVIQNK